MSESLSTRVKRLVSGAINGGVDAAELAMSETVMKESVREIERTIDDVREEVSKFQAQRHVAAKRIAHSEEKIERLAEQARMGLSAGREDLAQAAVERQFDLEAQIPVLKETQEEATNRIAELSAAADALRGRKAEMEEELHAYKAAQADELSFDDAGNVMAYDASIERRAAKAENAFDRVMKNASGVSGIGKSERDTVAKIAELETMQRRHKVDERLQALRDGMTDDVVKAG